MWEVQVLKGPLPREGVPGGSNISNLLKDAEKIGR